MNPQASSREHARSKLLFPGGVNSPVRAFKAVGRDPLYIPPGEGAHLVDVDGNRFLDYVLRWGPLLPGHPHPPLAQAIAAAAPLAPPLPPPTPPHPPPP